MAPQPQTRELRDTQQLLFVKYTVANAQNCGPNDNFETLFSDVDRAGKTICAQYETFANVYDTGAGDNYVAFLDNTILNGSAELLDYQFSEDNLEGSSVPGVSYDRNTGIVYIPKHLYEKNGAESFRPLMAQLLLRRDLSSQDKTLVDVAISSSYPGISPANEQLGLEADPLDCTLVLPVVEPERARRLSLNNFRVWLADSERPLELRANETASFDPQTGELSLAVSPLTLARVQVEIVPSDLAAAALDAITLPAPANAAQANQLGMWPFGSFDKLDVSKLKPGQTFSYQCHIKYDLNANQFADIRWANVTVKRAAPYVFSSFENGRGDNSVGSTNWMFNQLKAGVTWDALAPYVATQPISSHLSDVNFMFSLPGDGQSASESWMLNGLDFGGLTSPCYDASGKVDVSKFINAPAFCTHIHQPANRLSIQDAYDDKMATTTMHILKIQSSGTHPYVIVGFCTPEIATQSGIAVIKFGIKTQGSLELTKVSSAPQITSSNASYSLAGTQFELLAADKTTHIATLTTNASGVAAYKDLSAGTYYVKELSAPLGFIANSEFKQVSISAGNTTKIELPNIPVTDAEWPLAQKLDSQLGTTPQGNATLKGAEFEVKLYGNTEGNTSGTPLKTWVFTSDEQGLVRANAAHLLRGDSLYTLNNKAVLPLGTYTVREIAPPAGYQLGTPQTKTCILSTQNATPSWSSPGWSHPEATTTSGRGITNEVIRGGVQIEKLDSEGHAPRGASSLEGTVFSITYQGSSPIVLNNAVYHTGDEVLTITAHQVPESSPARFVAATAPDALPFGSYRISEKTPGQGYISSITPQDFTISGPHATLLTLNAVPNDPIRGGFSFNKVNEGMEPLANIPFLITSQQDADKDGKLERHVLITDANGTFSTTTTEPSNRNDAALIEQDGELSVQEDRIDSSQGIWFSGRTDETTPPQGPYALPYGSYTVEELPCSANKGLKLVSFTLTINAHHVVVNRGTVIDGPAPSISTQLMCTDTNSKLLGEGTQTLVDTVHYFHLEPGERYTLTGTLYNAHTKEPLTTQNNEPIQSSTNFVATAEHGSVEVPFKLSSSDLTATQLVAVQTLHHNGKLIAKHDDLASPDQSVYVPHIRTQVSRAASSLAASAIDSTTQNVALIDQVQYENLIAGQTYRLKAQVYDRDAEQLLADEHGSLSYTAEFTPDAPNGTTPVHIDLPASMALGKNLVIYEELLLQDTTLCTHADKNDLQQQISIPAITSEFGLSTTANTLDHFVDTTAFPLEASDVVQYEGLVPGEHYVLRGTLHNQVSELPLTNNDGSPIMAEQAFVAEASSGTLQQTFTLQTAPSDPTVAFEELYTADGTLLASDSDRNNSSQTMWNPRLKTHLLEQGSTDAHLATTSTDAVLIDTLSFEGLKPNEAYTIKTTLIDTATGDALPQANGKTVSEQEFTPAVSSGTHEVEIHVNPQEVTCSALVAFEELYLNGELVVSHMDASDPLQTLTLARLQTVLTERTTQQHSVARATHVTLDDAVSYTGLTPGLSYMLSSTLVDKHTGKELVHQEQSFTPEQPQGEQLVSFELDLPSDSHEVVALEVLSYNGRIIAHHTDLADKNQTVEFTSPPAAKGRTPRTGDYEMGLTGVVAVLLGTGLIGLAFALHKSRYLP